MIYDEAEKWSKNSILVLKNWLFIYIKSKEYIKGKLVGLST